MIMKWTVKYMIKFHIVTSGTGKESKALKKIDVTALGKVCVRYQGSYLWRRVILVIRSKMREYANRKSIPPEHRRSSIPGRGDPKGNMAFPWHAMKARLVLSLSAIDL